MKKNLIILLGFFLAFTAYSQDTLAVSDYVKSEAIVSRLTRELGLEQDQQEKVYSIMQTRWENIRKTKDRTKANQKTLADLKKVLTTQQYEIFLELREENKKQKQTFKTENPDFVFTDTDQDLDF